jgi:hypothetical protein
MWINFATFAPSWWDYEKEQPSSIWFAGLWKEPWHSEYPEDDHPRLDTGRSMVPAGLADKR